MNSYHVQEVSSEFQFLQYEIKKDVKEAEAAKSDCHVQVGLIYHVYASTAEKEIRSFLYQPQNFFIESGNNSWSQASNAKQGSPFYLNLAFLSLNKINIG